VAQTLALVCFSAEDQKTEEQRGTSVSEKGSIWTERIHTIIKILRQGKQVSSVMVNLQQWLNEAMAMRRLTGSLGSTFGLHRLPAWVHGRC